MEYGQMIQQAKENAKQAFYQNPGYQLERRKKKSFLLKVEFTDTSTSFNVKLHEPLIIDTLSDIYLENFTTYHTSAITGSKQKSGFLLKINEFNHQGNSNENNSFNKLFIPNEYTGDITATTRKIHKGKKLNYIASVNPSTLYDISGTITDLGDSSGNFGNMFNNNSLFLAEFVIISRD